MKRRGILELTEEILKLLSAKKEYSTKQVADKLHCQWRTAIKCLEFLKRIGLVKETAGNKTYRTERVWKRI